MPDLLDSVLLGQNTSSTRPPNLSVSAKCCNRCGITSLVHSPLESGLHPRRCRPERTDRCCPTLRILSLYPTSSRYAICTATFQVAVHMAKVTLNPCVESAKLCWGSIAIAPKGFARSGRWLWRSDDTFQICWISVVNDYSVRIRFRGVGFFTLL